MRLSTTELLSSLNSNLECEEDIMKIQHTSLHLLEERVLFILLLSLLLFIAKAVNKVI